jgi:GR25 family glycosyltransferase involved in LPS biosynthesis
MEIPFLMTIDEYFDRIFVINLDSRPDRWQSCLHEFARHGIRRFERFRAYHRPLVEGEPNGNFGCTASHRAILEIVAYHRWPRVLVLEDDFMILHGDFQERFSSMLPEVPPYDMLYLGGHYAEKAQAKVSEHVIRINGMHTTSSYGITPSFARKIAPYISGIGPIDSLYSRFLSDAQAFIFTPRLIVQRPGVSNLTGRESNNVDCMLDPACESI